MLCCHQLNWLRAAGSSLFSADRGGAGNIEVDFGKSEVRACNCSLWNDKTAGHRREAVECLAKILDAKDA